MAFLPLPTKLVLSHSAAPTVVYAAQSCCSFGLQDTCAPVGVKHQDAPALTDAAAMLMRSGVQGACVPVAVKHHNDAALC